MSDSLVQELVELIIESCGIEDIAPNEVDLDAPLIGPESPLGLDSLDAVEVVASVQKTFNARIGGEVSSRAVLQSVRTLADFIRKEQKQEE